MTSKTLTAPGKTTKVSKTIKELLSEGARDDLIVTPPYNRFLTTWNEEWPEPVIKRISEVMLTPQRDRRYKWSASGAGRCLRRQEFAFLGAPVVGQYDPQLRRIFLNGTWVHLRNQATLLAAGILDNIEVTIKRPSLRARCTMDGMGEAKGGRYDGAAFGYELKSANDWSYNHQVTKGASAKTRAQVDFEFLMSGFDLFVIFNENKNTQGIQEWVVVRDENRVQEAKKELIELNKAVDNHRLHPQLDECRKQLKSGEFLKCPYGGEGGICANTGKWPTTI